MWQPDNNEYQWIDPSEPIPSRPIDPTLFDIVRNARNADNVLEKITWLLVSRSAWSSHDIDNASRMVGSPLNSEAPSSVQNAWNNVQLFCNHVRPNTQTQNKPFQALDAMMAIDEWFDKFVFDPDTRLSHLHVPDEHKRFDIHYHKDWLNKVDTLSNETRTHTATCILVLVSSINTLSTHEKLYKVVWERMVAFSQANKHARLVFAPSARLLCDIWFPSLRPKERALARWASQNQ